MEVIAGATGLSGRIERRDRTEHVLPYVLAATHTLTQLPDEVHQPVIGRGQLRRGRKAGGADIEDDVEQTSDQVVCSFLQRVPVTMRQPGESETAATAAALAQVERWNPRFRHAHSLLCTSEGKTSESVQHFLTAEGRWGYGKRQMIRPEY